MKQLNGVVLKQWALSKVEILKSALYAGYCAIAMQLFNWIFQIVTPEGVVHLPTKMELLKLAGSFITAVGVFLLQYIPRPTRTIVDGKIEHGETVTVNTKKEDTTI